MKKFNWAEFLNKNNKIAVHCKTEEEAVDFCEQMDRHGLRFSGGRSYAFNNYWGTTYKEKMIYSNDGKYGTEYNFNRCSWKIYEWSDYTTVEGKKNNEDIMKQKDYDREIALLKAKITKLEQDKVTEKKGNPFNVGNGDAAYYNDSPYIVSCYDRWSEYGLDKYIPCKDKNIVIARQLRHRLNDLLEKFAYDNDAVVTEEMLNDKTIQKWGILQDLENKGYFTVLHMSYRYLNIPYFTTKKVAQRAIKEVIIPFNEGRL